MTDHGSDRGPGRWQLWRFSARLLRRDLGSGRLLMMLLAATIAVASTVSVGLLVERVSAMMVAESSALLAADLAIVTRDPPPPRYAQRAQAFDLKSSATVNLRSVVAKADALQLVQLKAVDKFYPLHGELHIADTPLGDVELVRSGPARGAIWADNRAFQLLDLTVGDEVDIGSSRFVVKKLLVLEPDRGGDLFAFAPRVMMNLDDLSATGLLVPGSRASYKILLAGPPAAISGYRQGLTLDSGHSVQDPRSARPEAEGAFVQAERFLSLAAFVGVLLATVGIALCASAYREHHESSVAIFKTLGLTRGNIAQVMAGEIFLLAMLATLLGNLIALAVQQVLLGYFLTSPQQQAPPIAWLPFVHGAWVAICVLAGFALPALIQLAQLPVTQVLNRDRMTITSSSWLPLCAMFLAAVLIAPWHLGQANLVAISFAGMLASALVTAATAYAMVRLLARLRSRTGIGWRFSLANIARRSRLSVLQCSAIGMGIAVVLLLGLVREDLMTQWRSRLPPQAPNHFLINIHDDEKFALRTFLEAQVPHQIALYPMIRGRLTAINQLPVVAESYAEPRARRLAEREFNLSYASQMKADNRLVAGRWWQNDSAAEMSVERGIAKTLGIKLGDSLRFHVADRDVEATVTSLREVDWDNFEVNFFVVATPQVLFDTPRTWITSFYLDRQQRALMPALVKQFPSVTVIDVDALMRQVRQVMDRVAQALSWVFGFALLAGVVVLIAAVQASQRERLLDVVLLKTLGASRRFITTSLLLEFVVIGALAGALGSSGAAATGWLLAHYVLDLAYAPSWSMLLTGVGAGIVGVTVLGAALVYQNQRRSVVAGLREAV